MIQNKKGYHLHNIEKGLLFILAKVVLFLRYFHHDLMELKHKPSTRIVIFFLLAVFIFHLALFVKYDSIEELLNFMQQPPPIQQPMIMNPLVAELDETFEETEVPVESQIFSNRNHQAVQWVGDATVIPDMTPNTEQNENQVEREKNDLSIASSLNEMQKYQQWQQNRDQLQNRGNNPDSGRNQMEAANRMSQTQVEHLDHLRRESFIPQENPTQEQEAARETGDGGEEETGDSGDSPFGELIAAGNGYDAGTQRKSYSGTISFDPNNPPDFSTVKIDDYELYRYIINMGWQTLRTWDKFLPKRQLAWGLLNPGEVTMEFSIDEQGFITYYKFLRENDQPSINRSTEQALEYAGSYGEQPDNVIIKKLVFQFRVYPVEYGYENSNEGRVQKAYLTYGITLNFDIDKIEGTNQ